LRSFLSASLITSIASAKLSLAGIVIVIRPCRGFSIGCIIFNYRLCLYHIETLVRKCDTLFEMKNHFSKKQRKLIIALLVVVGVVFVSFMVFSYSKFSIKQTSGGVSIERLIPKEAVFVARYFGTNNEENPRVDKLVDISTSLLLASFFNENESQTLAPRLSSNFVDGGQFAFVILNSERSATGLAGEKILFSEIENVQAYRTFLESISIEAQRTYINNSLVLEQKDGSPRYIGIVGDVAFFADVSGKKLAQILDQKKSESILSSQEFSTRLKIDNSSKGLKKGYMFLTQNAEVDLSSKINGKIKDAFVLLNSKNSNLVADVDVNFSDSKESSSTRDLSSLTTFASNIPSAMAYIVAQNAQEFLDELPLLESNKDDGGSFYKDKPFVFALEDVGSILPAFTLFIDGGANAQETKSFFKNLQRRIVAWASAVNIVLSEKDSEEKKVFEFIESSAAYSGAIKISLANIAESVSNIPLLHEVEPFTFSYGLNFRNQLYFTTSPDFFTADSGNFANQNNSINELVAQSVNADQIFAADAKMLDAYIKRVASFAKEKDAISTTQQNGLELVGKILDELKGAVASSKRNEQSAKGEFVFVLE